MTLTSPEATAMRSQFAAIRTSDLALGPLSMAHAYSALATGDYFLGKGDRDSGEVWLRQARLLADVALGFTPVGEYLQIYSAVVGHNLITGEALSTAERVIAAVSVVTFGGYKAFKAYQQWDSAGTAVAAAAGRAGPFPATLTRALHGLESMPTNDLNLALQKANGYTELPFLPNLRAYRFTLPESSTSDFARVYSKSERNTIGRWLVEKSSIEGKTGAEIARALRLPAIPDMVSDVALPAGREIIKGPLNYRAFDEIYGAGAEAAIPARQTQYFVEGLSPVNFPNPRPLP